MTTGERIKLCRKERGISAESLAEKCGISPATVYRYENGDIEKVSIDKLRLIAEALNVSAAYLLGWLSHGDDTDEDLAFMMSLREDSNSGRKAARAEMFRCYGADHRAQSTYLVEDDKVALLYYRAFERYACMGFREIVSAVEDLDQDVMDQIRLLVVSYLKADEHTRQIVDLTLEPFRKGETIDEKFG